MEAAAVAARRRGNMRFVALDQQHAYMRLSTSQPEIRSERQ
jgi:hypothetical protein